MSKLNKSDIVFFGFGTLFVLLGILLGTLWPFIYQSVLQTNLILKPDSKSFEMWEETPLPMYLDIYLFNWTNAVEHHKNPKLKPKFEEVGPFVFREVHDRVNITWHDDGTVSYNQTRRWNFIAEESVDLKSEITNLNVIALGAAHSTRYSGAIINKLLNWVFKIVVENKLYVTKPANEWLFDGMNLTLLDLLHEPFVQRIVSLKIPIPDKFGFFYERNMSAAYDGHFRVETGLNELNNLGNVMEWNYHNKTDFFDDQCASIEGSSGEIFPPTAINVSNFSLFIPDVCSTLTLQKSGSLEFHSLTGTEFAGDETMFDNGTSLPEQKCFCRGECIPSGVRNLTDCRQGAPVFASFPHFYSADPSYLQMVDGLSPNKSLHEFRLTLEPTTGIPLDVRAQIQVNMLLQPYSKYGMFENVARAFIPMLWFSQRATINPSLASQVRLLLNVRVTGLAITLILSLLGIFLITGRSFYIYRRNREILEDEEPIIRQPDEVS